jgi:hypothetical protein
VTNVYAFAPKNFWHGIQVPGGTHQSITEAVITDFDHSQFGSFTLGMEGAMAEIVEANAAVDLDQTKSELHFDGENFEGGQDRVLSLRVRCIAALTEGADTEARSLLGQALHTIQDFYSHSSWVEMGNTQPNQQLGVPGQKIASVASDSITTCNGSSLSSSLLTSGYFAGIKYSFGFGYHELEDRIPPSPTIAKKCIHGGPLDWYETWYQNGGINKDFADPLLSGHSQLHDAAAAMATLATEKFISELAINISPEQLALLLGADTRPPDRILFTSARGGWAGLIDKFGVTLAANGWSEQSDNGAYLDIPQAAYFGDYSVNLEISQGIYSIIYTVYFPQYVRVLKIPYGFREYYNDGVLAKNSYLTMLGAGEGYAGTFEINISTPQLAKSRNDDATDRPISLLSLSGAWDGSSKTNVVPVDCSITQMSVSLAGTGSVSVLKPDGVPVKTNDPGVSLESIPGELLYSIGSPGTGKWTIVTSGSGSFHLDVTGHGAIDFSSFEFVELGGRPGHEGFFRIPGSPVTGLTNAVHCVVVGPITNAQFDFRNASAETLQYLPLLQGTNAATGEFFGQVELPSIPFLVYVTGNDTNGNVFQRLFPATNQVQPLEVRAPLAQDLVPGQTTAYTFRVTNQGPPNAFTCTAFDDKRYVGSVTPTNFALGTSEATDVSVNIETPDDWWTSSGSSDLLTVTVLSTGAPTALNSASVLSGVFPPPVLNLKVFDGQVSISWTGVGILQTAKDLSGPWSDVVTAPSSYISQTTNGQAFFRVRE